MPNYNNYSNYSNPGYYPITQQYGQTQMMPSPQMAYQQNAQMGSTPFNTQQRAQQTMSSGADPTWVHGMAGASSFNQPKGTTSMLMDDTEQLFYVKETDPYTGRPTITAYRYEKVDLENGGASRDSSTMVSRSEFEAMRQQLNQIQAMLSNQQSMYGPAQSSYGQGQGQTQNQGQNQNRSE